MAQVKDIAYLAWNAGRIIRSTTEAENRAMFEDWWVDAGVIERQDRVEPGELHRLHKMIHTLRNECVSEMSDEEIDELAGVEPECATCHGFGPNSGQAPIPVELAVYDTTHTELLTPDKLEQADKVLRGVGLKLLYKTEEGKL